jgi:hypothetical protein
MKKLMIAVAALALLGGCIKVDKTPPKDLPAYVTLYPGSTQVMNVSIGGVTADAATTPDTPDTVMTFYRSQASANGLTESAAPASAGATAGQEQANFTDTSGKMLMVVAKPQSNLTLVTLTWKTPPASGS